jgi:transcription elongation GreA/GreB family factor
VAKKTSDIKEQLHAACLAYANKRIQTATEAYEMAQGAANEESKNTSSDDDNSKAMLQIEAEQQAKHVAEARKLKEEMLRIEVGAKSSSVGPGSLVTTNNGNYYIGISAGKIEIGKTVYYAISISAPIGQALKGLKKGDKTKFNGKLLEITDVS